MVRFLIRRLVSLLITLWLMSICIFAITMVLPGDVAQMIMGKSATPQDLATLRHQLGLDQPAYLQYLHWFGGVLHGDLGTSVRTGGCGVAFCNDGVQVSTLLGQRSANSAVLAVAALVIGVPVSIGLGVLAAVRRDTWIDRLINVFVLTWISVPEFVTGMLLIIVFAIWLHLIPALSIADPNASGLDSIIVLILPALTLALVMLAQTARMTRASMIEELRSNYVRTALLKGMAWRTVIFKHALRNALVPTATVIAMNIGWLMGGLIVVETVFAYPGLGQLVTFAIGSRDVPLLQGVALLIAAVYSLSNLAADLIYTYLNPKISYA
jgi:peptide/nickel transport system permease protein